MEGEEGGEFTNSIMCLCVTQLVVGYHGYLFFYFFWDSLQSRDAKSSTTLQSDTFRVVSFLV